MTLTCPTDSSPLQAANDHDVPYAACPSCGGGWFELDQFERLEASAGNGNALAGTIEYAERATPLACPSCGKPMVAFDYRGEDLALDACDAEHGFWLARGDADRIRERMRERVRGLERAAKVEGSWNAERERGFKPTLSDRLRRMLGGR